MASAPPPDGQADSTSALISSIVAACADESIVVGDAKGRTKAFVEGLVGRYQPEYADLTFERLWKKIRFDCGYEMWGGETETLTSKKELEGLLPAVIEATDGLMEERRKIDGAKRKREGEEKDSAEAASEEKGAAESESPGRKKKKEDGEEAGKDEEERRPEA